MDIILPKDVEHLTVEKLTEYYRNGGSLTIKDGVYKVSNMEKTVPWISFDEPYRRNYPILDATFCLRSCTWENKSSFHHPENELSMIEEVELTIKFTPVETYVTHTVSSRLVRLNRLNTARDEKEKTEKDDHKISAG